VPIDLTLSRAVVHAPRSDRSAMTDDTGLRCDWNPEQSAAVTHPFLQGRNRDTL
jgi:hypothetical protein